jgi:hypothetical protein
MMFPCVIPEINRGEYRQHHHDNEARGRKQMLRRPKEIDTVQESDEQRRIAERRQRAPHIGYEEYGKYQHMRIVLAMQVRANQRAHRDHGGARGADKARQHGTNEKHAGVAGRRAVKVAGHDDAAGHHIERKQERNEAHVVEQHRS